MSIVCTCAVKQINGQLRGDGCVTLWRCVETNTPNRRSFRHCTWQTVATSTDVDEAAVDKRFRMPGEATTRQDSGGGCNTSDDVELPKIEGVVRE